MASKRQLLDVIGSTCKLILLNFHPEGTKIRIVGNAIELDNSTVSQGFYRMINKESREDICALFPVISRFIELYLMKKTEDTDMKESVKRLAEYLCRGLEILQKTYDYDNAVFTLQYFIIILKNGIDEKYDRKMIPKHLNSENENNLLDNEKIGTSWENAQVKDISNLFDKLFEAQERNDKVMIEALDCAILKILSHSDANFKELVAKTMM